MSVSGRVWVVIEGAVGLVVDAGEAVVVVVDGVEDAAGEAISEAIDGVECDGWLFQMSHTDFQPCSIMKRAGRTNSNTL